MGAKEGAQAHGTHTAGQGCVLVAGRAWPPTTSRRLRGGPLKRFPGPCTHAETADRRAAAEGRARNARRCCWPPNPPCSGLDCLCSIGGDCKARRRRGQGLSRAKAKWPLSAL